MKTKTVPVELTLSSYAATAEHAVAFLYQEAVRVNAYEIKDVKLVLVNDELAGYGYSARGVAQGEIEVEVDDRFIDGRPF